GRSPSQCAGPFQSRCSHRPRPGRCHRSPFPSAGSGSGRCRGSREKSPTSSESSGSKMRMDLPSGSFSPPS
ncbi:Helix-turn-helix domain, partial [Dysosmobacter welbionis]